MRVVFGIGVFFEEELGPLRQSDGWIDVTRKQLLFTTLISHEMALKQGQFPGQFKHSFVEGLQELYSIRAHRHLSIWVPDEANASPIMHKFFVAQRYGENLRILIFLFLPSTRHASYTQVFDARVFKVVTGADDTYGVSLEITGEVVEAMPAVPGVVLRFP